MGPAPLPSLLLPTRLAPPGILNSPSLSESKTLQLGWDWGQVQLRTQGMGGWRGVFQAETQHVQNPEIRHGVRVPAVCRGKGLTETKVPGSRGHED